MKLIAWGFLNILVVFTIPILTIELWKHVSMTAGLAAYFCLFSIWGIIFLGKPTDAKAYPQKLKGLI